MELEYRVIPSVDLGDFAWDASRHPPVVVWIVDILMGSSLQHAFRTENEPLAADGLVHIKFQCLGRAGTFQVVINVVNEVVSGILAAQLLPPKGVGIRRGAADTELGRGPVHGGRCLLLSHRMSGDRAVAAIAGASGARLPSGHLIDARNGCLSDCWHR